MEKVRFEGNGDRLIVESGGSIIVRNGGIVRAESGATIDMPEQVEFFAGTSFTLSPRERWVRTTSASAVSIVVPPYSAVPFPPGTSRTVLQGGTGQVTFVAGDGVTINSPETLKIAKRYAAAVVMATETRDVWDLMGYLEAA
ncbi:MULTISPECIES: hypothetical protein [unclassified Mesorhizobium]|uniref:hypothetical protein n=1 Tax=unclassified Mesorhizobium TaxID=325217 RepID=UPI0003CE120A|nr:MULTISPECIES: hypothetical protein [unclassified Mesorhizobium]ESY58298.1 hypothetical protein X745_04165 [Mesorhizobium sp. LNJC374B00]ESY59432.1 hypothetical protein X744_12805 [Mesorhizobium sp. LNJC372A00]WJI79501.1 hypothetical protein NLY34_21890 [Mesorhizobium sp. C374B]WJI86036.1 hypothetical protein NLY42_24285 [Mesorhizobium sp. C372A]